jgi:hypothetical protein
MQGNRPESRLNFIEPAHAETPQIFHWLLNTIRTTSIAASYLTAQAPRVAAVPGAIPPQLIFGPAAHGPVATLMATLRIGATTLGIEMLFTMYCIRHERQAVVRAVIHDGCEECLQPWLR